MSLTSETEVVVQKKPFSKSASFQGVLLAAIPFVVAVLRAIGVPVPEVSPETVAGAITQGLGILWATYGVLRRKDIGLK